MKAGKSIQELAQALHHARESARDFVVPASQMKAIPDEGGEGINIEFAVKGERNEVILNPWSHGQLATYAEVPKAYYDRIVRENAQLAADSVNHGIARANGDKRMLRTLDGTMRALLSPKFRRLDSADLVDAVLPGMMESGMEMVSSDITERRLYLRAVTSRLQADVAVGDTVQAGIMISNSDVGAGSLRVEPFLLRLVCNNGMVREHAFKKAHIGRSLAVGEDSIELLSESTVRLGEAAFWAEVKDVVTGCLRPELFEAEIEKLRQAAKQKITNFDLQEVVELTCRTLGLATTTETTKTSIVELLASGNQGAGLTRYGLANSFTAAASLDGLNFDQAVELERAGSAVIDLPASSWKIVAEKK